MTVFLALLAGTSPALAGNLRLIALGDSLTAGYGLAPEEGFTAQLADWLHANGAADVEVVNMGVSGDTTAGGRARLDWALGEGADAVIVALGGNDLLRAIPPEVSRANLAAILEALSARGLPVLLAGMRAPLNYGPAYQRDFDAIYPELAERHGALLYPFFLEGLVGAPELMQADGLHPNPAGVARMVEGIGPMVLALLARARR